MERTKGRAMGKNRHQIVEREATRSNARVPWG
jgi:hypothetical protein